MATKIADYMVQDNPNFSRVLFLEACGFEGGEYPIEQVIS